MIECGCALLGSVQLCEHVCLCRNGEAVCHPQELEKVRVYVCLECVHPGIWALPENPPCSWEGCCTQSVCKLFFNQKSRKACLPWVFYLVLAIAIRVSWNQAKGWPKTKHSAATLLSLQAEACWARNLKLVFLGGIIYLVLNQFK